MPTGQSRGFPAHTLEEALAVARKIQDEMAGKPFRRLLLAEALSIKPSSSKFRELLSSSYKYGLTEGTEKAAEIALTPLGADALQTQDAPKRLAALRNAAYYPNVFSAFYKNYEDHKLPSPDMMRKLLSSEFKIPSQFAEECSRILMENGRYAEIIRDIGGSPHVLICETSGAPVTAAAAEQVQKEDDTGAATSIDETKAKASVPSAEKTEIPSAPRAIFVGHGKKHAPLAKLEKILASFHIPYKVAEEEANLGRPISKKVRDTMLQCGSAILIFTCDEKFKDDNGDVIWRPSENVVHELGAASYAYEDRVVIFKEKEITFPTNFKDVGYIEFEENSIESKTTDLLKELIGFGLVKITTTG